MRPVVGSETAYMSELTLEYSRPVCVRRAKPPILVSKRSVPLWLSEGIHSSGYRAHFIRLAIPSG